MRIVECDNYDRDYTDEKFLNIPSVSEIDALKIVNAIEASFPQTHSSHWKVVPDDYKILSPNH